MGIKEFFLGDKKTGPEGTEKPFRYHIDGRSMSAADITSAYFDYARGGELHVTFDEGTDSQALIRSIYHLLSGKPHQWSVELVSPTTLVIKESQPRSATAWNPHQPNLSTYLDRMDEGSPEWPF